MDEPRWTLDELAQRARQALAADGVRAPNGRVHELGDGGRAIRWYGTKGLVDRPEIGPGHSARYGPRHLLQLVAVKRLQARGLTLAQIQQQLAGATDEALQSAAEIELATLIDAAASDRASAPVQEAARAAVPAPGGRFWAAASRAARETAVPAPAPVQVPAPPSAPAPAPSPALAPAHEPAPAPALAPPGPTAAEIRYLIPLAGDVTLALCAAPAPADIEALRAAAAPLLELLAQRGLTAPDRTRERERNQGD